jgi:hypothetical protein
MIVFTKPEKLNGIQLREELRNVGIEIGDGRTVVIIGNELHLDINETDKNKASEIVAVHIGIENEPTPADKLAAAGLTVDELKAVLGIN